MPPNPYARFVQERYASGDLHSIKLGEAGKLIAQEWKSLPASEKKVCFWAI
jgi:hypothetical protein